MVAIKSYFIATKKDGEKIRSEVQCSGFIIGRHYVLTAGHCIINFVMKCATLMQICIQFILRILQKNNWLITLLQLASSFMRAKHSFGMRMSKFDWPIYFNSMKKLYDGKQLNSGIFSCMPMTLPSFRYKSNPFMKKHSHPIFSSFSIHLTSMNEFCQFAFHPVGEELMLNRQLQQSLDGDIPMVCLWP